MHIPDAVAAVVVRNMGWSCGVEYKTRSIIRTDVTSICTIYARAHFACISDVIYLGCVAVFEASSSSM